MRNNDTSDEAYLEWIQGKKNVFPRDVAAEWHRRCKVQMEDRERKAFEAGMRAALEGDLEPSEEFISEAYIRIFKKMHPK